MITKTLSDTARRILDTLIVQGNTVKIPLLSGNKPEPGVYQVNGMLERELYEEVNAALAAIGGKWNKKARAHIFEDDPAEAIDEIQLTGQFKRMKSAKQLLGFFETPEETACQLVELAEITPEHSVLEPSAGRGRIVDKILKYSRNISIVELDQKNCVYLRSQGHPVHCADFLQLTDYRGGFDRVVMNPPFAKQADHDHVLHAYGMLKPGGRLVSIMAAGVTYRTTKKSERVRALVDEGHGEIIELPPGTFHESGTEVSTVIVVINK